MDNPTIRKLLAQLTSTTAPLDRSGVRKALEQATAPKLALSERDRHRLAEAAGMAHMAAQVQETLARPASFEKFQKQIREIVEKSGLHAKVAADMRIALADSASQALSWDAVVETAELLEQADRQDVEEIYDTASEELREIEADDSSLRLSPISIAAAIVYARIVVAATLVMLLTWTDFKISQEGQALFDLALEILGLMPANSDRQGNGDHAE